MPHSVKLPIISINRRHLVVVNDERHFSGIKLQEHKNLIYAGNSWNTKE